LTITENGKPCAKIVPVKAPVDRKAALALLRSLETIDLPPRKLRRSRWLIEPRRY